MAHGQDADQTSAQFTSSAVNSQGMMASQDACRARNGEASTLPPEPAVPPRMYPEASNLSLPPSVESLEGCKLQVAQLARDETQLEVELHNSERDLVEAQKQKQLLEEKIVQLDQPLSINLESVELSDEDMKILGSPGRQAEMQSAISEPADLLPSMQLPHPGPDCTSELIEKDSIHRLGEPTGSAERNLLQTQQCQQFLPILSAPADAESAPKYFGRVPAMAALPEDHSVAAILACNRYRSAVSHIDSLQRLPAHIQQAAFAAQHYMSGRQWIMTIKPQAGTAWSLPGVQEAIEKHRVQVQELSATLQAVQDEQRTSAESSAKQLAAQLWSVRPPRQLFSDHPGRGAVVEHMHNFRCNMPAQLNQREQWRQTFVDDGGLVEDPVALLQEASFTSPWTKREREVMDNMLGEQGKRFAYVAKEVGSRSIADCIDRYYKVHLRDEFKPTWRKMARIKRAVDGKHKREEHSKVLAPVSKVSSRPRHSAWAGSLAHAGASAGCWPPMSTARLTAAVSGTAGDFGVALASLGSAPESIRPQGRYQGRRRGTAAPDRTHAAVPAQSGPTGFPVAADMLTSLTPSALPFLSDQVSASVQEPRLPVLSSGFGLSGVSVGGHAQTSASPMELGDNVETAWRMPSTPDAPALQIEGLRTLPGPRSESVAEASHPGFGVPFCASSAPDSGLDCQNRVVGSGVPSNAALYPTGTQGAQDGTQRSFPLLDQEMAAQGARFGTLERVSSEAHQGDPYVKGTLAKFGNDPHPTDLGHGNPMTGAPADPAKHMAQVDSPQEQQC